ncbi:MAG: hypothetical protein ACEY3K_01855, partial [Wolbachia sp.]
MEKIQAINELYNSIYAALKANSDLRKYVTNIYDYLPKQVTIPYLRLRVVNYNNLHMLSNFATKARFSCDIYSYLSGESHLSPLDCRTVRDRLPSYGSSAIWSLS